jgi:hypothetical protein
MLLFFVVSLAIANYHPVIPFTDLDSSGAFSLAELSHLKYQFGKDIVYSFGPYSTLYTHLFSPYSDVLTLLLLLFIAVIITTNLIILSKNLPKKYLLLIFAIPLIGFSNIDAIYLLLPFLILSTIFKQLMLNNNINPLYLILSVSCLGLISLSKGTFFALSLATIVCLFILFFLFNRYKLLIITALAYCLSFTFFWFVAGQKLLNIFSFIYYVFSISSAYTDIMSSYINVYNDIVTIILLTAIIYILFRELDLSFNYKVLSIIFIAITLFFVFKAAFVRNDYPHTSIFYSSIIIFALLLPLLYKLKSFNILFLSGFLIIFALFNQLVIYSIFDYNPYNNIIQQAKGVYIRITDPKYFANKYASNLQTIRDEYELPTLPGTTDIYRNRQTYLLVSDNKWNPRPAFQSINVFNSQLSKLNEGHLLDELKAPDNIFYRMETVDIRFPTMDDTTSLPLIIANYTLKGEYKDYLIFQKNDHLQTLNLDDKLILSKTANIGEKVDISSYENPLFIKIYSDKTMLGKFMLLIYKITPLFIEITLEDDINYSFRLNPNVTTEGFIISPLIATNSQLKQFISSNNQFNQSNKVKSFSLNLEIPQMKSFYLSKFVHIFYKDKFSYSLYSLN